MTAGIQKRKSFNPRPYVRGDAKRLKSGNMESEFQSAPLREGRWETGAGYSMKSLVSIRAPT